MILVNIYTGELLDANAVGAWTLPQYLYPAGDWAIQSGDVSDISDVRTTAQVIAETAVLASNNPGAAIAVEELLAEYPDAIPLLPPEVLGAGGSGSGSVVGVEAAPENELMPLLSVLGAAYWLLK